MGHLAAGTTEPREALSPGVLEKDSWSIGGYPVQKGEASGQTSYLCALLLKNRKVLGARTKGRGHTGWWRQGRVFSSRGPLEVAKGWEAHFCLFLLLHVRGCWL